MDVIKYSSYIIKQEGIVWSKNFIESQNNNQYLKFFNSTSYMTSSSTWQVVAFSFIDEDNQPGGEQQYHVWKVYGI